jgi:formate transporter
VVAFVAAGFEHSIANMFYFPLAQLIGLETGMAAPGTAALFANLAVVIPGNLLGGSGLVALVYWVAYLRKPVEPR